MPGNSWGVTTLCIYYSVRKSILHAADNFAQYLGFLITSFALQGYMRAVNNDDTCRFIFYYFSFIAKQTSAYEYIQQAIKMGSRIQEALMNKINKFM